MKKIFFILALVLIGFGCKKNSNENQTTTTNQEPTTQTTDYQDVEEEVNYFDTANTSSFSEAELTVFNFLRHLNDGDFADAYSLVNNPAWGDYEKFSSKKGFGAITDIEPYEIRELYYPVNYSAVYVRAYYEDPVNGSHTYSEIFKIKNYQGKNKITGLILLKTDKELLNAPKKGFYEIKNGDGGMNITEINKSDKNFKFNISIVCPTLHTGDVEGTAYWKNDYYWEYNNTDNEFPCKLRFYFYSNKIIVEEVDCMAYHGVRCTFDAEFKYRNK